MRARLLAIAALALVVAAAGLGALRSCSGRPAPDSTAKAGPARATPPADGGAAPLLHLLPPSPAAGWRDAAETVAIDLHRFLLGRPQAGAFEEARAEAARADLALFPPDPAELRSMLLSPDGGVRTLALAALAARADASDDLLRIVLRSQ